MIEVTALNLNKGYNAHARYDEGRVIVEIGSYVNMDFSSSARGAIIKQYRYDESVVQSDGLVLKDCEFQSPSAAARFVTGRSVNGYNVWKVNHGEETLGHYLERIGKRVIKKRKTK